MKKKQMNLTIAICETETRPVFCLGLYKDKDYSLTDYSLIVEYGISYFEGIRWENVFRLDNEAREIILTMLSKAKTFPTTIPHYGFNFSAIMEYISTYYKESLGDATNFFPNPRKIYKKLEKAESSRKFQRETLVYINKICALYFISPEIILTGIGKVFRFTSTVIEKPDFMEHIKKYRDIIIKSFSNESEISDLPNERIPILLSKENICHWTDLDESDIIECDAVIAYNCTKLSKESTTLINSMIDYFLKKNQS